MRGRLTVGHLIEDRLWQIFVLFIFFRLHDQTIIFLINPTIANHFPHHFSWRTQSNFLLQRNKITKHSLQLFKSPRVTDRQTDRQTDFLVPFPTDRLIGRLIDWLFDRLTVWFIDLINLLIIDRSIKWSIDRLVDCLNDWLIDRLID